MTSNQGLFARLSNSRQSLSSRLKGIFADKPNLDESLFDDIEDSLIMADVGVQTTESIVTELKSRHRKNRYPDSGELLDGLKDIILQMLQTSDQVEIESNRSEPNQTMPHVILMVGVNGVGKTTTLAKIANRYKSQGSKVMLAACDTFRAAAVAQLQTWGEQLEIPVIAQSQGADAAAVAFDAYKASKARNIDYLLIDSAGRQHTHDDLMAQLVKIKKVLTKVNPKAPHETYITVDAGNGQNVISQVASFHNMIPLTGLCVSKLDGTAKGGIVIALAQKLEIPIRYIGMGEGVADLKPFVPEEFVKALLPDLDEL